MDHNDNVNSLIEQYKKDLLRYRQRSRPFHEPVLAPTQSEPMGSIPDSKSQTSTSPSQNTSSDWEQEAVPAQSPPQSGSTTSPSQYQTPQDLDPASPEPADNLPPTVMGNPSQETGTGYLRIEVTTARQAVPVEGAYVVVRQMGDGDVNLERVMRTDSEGKTATISLPTVPASLSMHPGTPHPYTEYSVQVDMPGYISVRDFNIPIYDGIVAIQPVELSPLPEGDTDGATQDIYESAPLDL
nr:hypothetical protein [uncultured Solibaculum sp.]